MACFSLHHLHHPLRSNVKKEKFQFVSNWFKIQLSYFDVFLFLLYSSLLLAHIVCIVFVMNCISEKKEKRALMAICGVTKHAKREDMCRRGHRGVVGWVRTRTR